MPRNTDKSPRRTDTSARRLVTHGLLLCSLFAPALILADTTVPPPPPLQGASAPRNQPAPGAPPTLPPPPIPEVNGAKRSLEPKVTIIHREHAVIEEYRVNGQLRYVKITPDKGPPYYLIDTTGNGLLDTRSDSLDNPPINQWILFRW